MREWLVAMTGVAALLVAIITFWTTARISGLEGYLRSEISRRNADLNTLSKHTAQAEQLANARAERLAALEGETNEIIASSLVAQSKLMDAESDLAQIHSEVGTARQQLVSAQQATSTLRSDFSRQSKAFDLLQRQQAYQHASFQVTMGTGFVNEGPVSGAVALEYIEKMQPPLGQAPLNRYLQIIKDNVERVCPTLRSWQQDLPESASAPPNPTITYVQGTSKRKLAELTRDAQQKWQK